MHDECLRERHHIQNKLQHFEKIISALSEQDSISNQSTNNKITELSHEKLQHEKNYKKVSQKISQIDYYMKHYAAKINS